MHIIEAIHLRIAVLDGGLEAGLSEPHKRRTQLRQPLDGGVRPNQFVMRQGDVAVLIGDRHDRAIEPTA